MLKSSSCTISRSPSTIGETERCYLVFRQLNYPQAEGTRPAERLSQEYWAKTIRIVLEAVTKGSPYGLELSSALFGLGALVGVLLPYSRLQEEE